MLFNAFSWRCFLKRKINFGKGHGMPWILIFFIQCYCNRLRSIYRYSCIAPRLSGQNCKFFKFLLSLNSQRRLRYKENNTKYGGLTWKPRSHIRILIYPTWPIENVLVHHTLIPCPMFSYSLDSPETKRIKVQPHSKKTHKKYVAQKSIRTFSSCFFSWQPALDDNLACVYVHVSFSLDVDVDYFRLISFLLTATQKTLAWDSASYSNQWTSEASFPGAF